MLVRDGIHVHAAHPEACSPRALCPEPRRRSLRSARLWRRCIPTRQCPSFPLSSGNSTSSSADGPDGLRRRPRDSWLILGVCRNYPARVVGEGAKCLTRGSPALPRVLCCASCASAEDRWSPDQRRTSRRGFGSHGRPRVGSGRPRQGRRPRGSVTPLRSSRERFEPQSGDSSFLRRLPRAQLELQGAGRVLPEKSAHRTPAIRQALEGQASSEASPDRSK